MSNHVKQQMDITVNLPVVFTAKALRGDEIRTVLGFVPTTFVLQEVDVSETRLVASAVRREGKLIEEYRTFDDAVYRKQEFPDGTPATLEDDIADTVQQLHRHMCELVRPEIEATRVDDLYPKNAKDLVSAVRWTLLNGEYRNYLDEARTRSESRGQRDLIASSQDFERAIDHHVGLAKRKLSEYLLVGPTRYRRTAGFAVCVESHYNVESYCDSTVRVETMDMRDASMWRMPVEMIGRSTDDTRRRFFAVTEMDEALSVADDIARKLGQGVSHADDDTTDFHVPVDDIPNVDMRYAELVRSAKLVCNAVGLEVARRIRNQEHSIFTDDRTVRYAFDRLAEALERADPFGEPDDTLEDAAKGMLDVIASNPRGIDARYRNLASDRAETFDLLRTCLEHWDERPMHVPFQRAAVRRP